MTGAGTADPGPVPAHTADRARFIASHTELIAPPLVPEIRLHLASEIVPIWELTEEELAERGVPPPFWAFAWAGGQALARYVLDHADIVRGRSVLDFGAGSGLVAIAAALAGAASVVAADIDPFAQAAIDLNAQTNGVSLKVRGDDLLDRQVEGYETILAADVCYEEPVARRITERLASAARAGIDVLIGDPGRTYLPFARLEKLAEYAVETTRELEDQEIRRTGVWRLKG